MGFPWFSDWSLFLRWSFFVLVSAPERASIQEMDGLDRDLGEIHVISVLMAQ